MASLPTSPTRPTCLILGLDGIDPDVLVNLLGFYTGCGFNTRVASKPAACELLVIQRGHALPGWLCPQVRGEVHVYDYVCNGTSDLAHVFPQAARIRVISPIGQPSGSSPVSPDWLVASPHPVVSALWAPRGRLAPRAERPYGLVHIGHHKPNPAGDYWQQEIQQLAGYTNCHFWGQGWRTLGGNLPQEHLHGPSSLHETQGIYRNAQAALGVMHDFQRGRTLSGRMWQAPLNGCLLYTEAVPPGMQLPGVQVVSSFSQLPHNDIHPDTLVEDARAHWDGVTNRLAHTLGLPWRAPSRLGLARLYLQQVALRHVKVSLERSRAAWGLGSLQKARA